MILMKFSLCREPSNAVYLHILCTFNLFSQHFAVMSPFPKKKQIIELFIRKGANINDKNKEWVFLSFIFIYVLLLLISGWDLYQSIAEGKCIGHGITGGCMHYVRKRWTCKFCAWRHNLEICNIRIALIYIQWNELSRFVNVGLFVHQ